MYQIYFILEWHSTCFGQSFRPSSAVQDCTYSNRHTPNRYCWLPASKQIAVSVWHLYVQPWTADDGRKDRPKYVECYSNKINFNALVHLFGFTIGKETQDVYCAARQSLCFRLYKGVKRPVKRFRCWRQVKDEQTWKHAFCCPSLYRNSVYNILVPSKKIHACCVLTVLIQGVQPKSGP